MATAGTTTVMLRVPVSSVCDCASVTRTTNVEAPAAPVGPPLMRPVLAPRDSPAGSDPVCTAYVYGLVPPDGTVLAWSKNEPVFGEGKEGDVTVSAAPTAPTTLELADAEPPSLLAVTTQRTYLPESPAASVYVLEVPPVLDHPETPSSDRCQS